jgi:hypothetical protein
VRIRTLGPGAIARLQRHKPSRSRGKARPAQRRDEPRNRPAGAMEADTRKSVAAALTALLETYPFGLLAARIADQDIDMILRCPATDLPLIADLVKKRLMGTIRDAGLKGRFWRKGFLRRALGAEGDLRRALVLFRRDAQHHRWEIIDHVRHDEKLGLRTRRPHPPIE